MSAYFFFFFFFCEFPVFWGKMASSFPIGVEQNQTGFPRVRHQQHTGLCSPSEQKASFAKNSVQQRYKQVKGTSVPASTTAKIKAIHHFQ